MTTTSLRRRVERMERAMNAASEVRLVDIICAAQELAERRARGEIIPEPTPRTEAELEDAERRGGLLGAFATIERRLREHAGTEEFVA